LPAAVAHVPEDAEPLLTSGEVARRLGSTPAGGRAVGRLVVRGLLTPAVATPGDGRYRFRCDDGLMQPPALAEEPDATSTGCPAGEIWSAW
jgi:hypothetical protein